jgi:hypothetical protein
VVRETLRLFPPATILNRGTVSTDRFEITPGVSDSANVTPAGVAVTVEMFWCECTASYDVIRRDGLP